MAKSRIILFLIAIIATYGIYQLPRFVVENKKGKVELSEPLSADKEHTSIDRELPENIMASIASFKELMHDAESIEKRVIFADSLAGVFQNALFYDSAANYLGLVADEIKNIERYRIAGDAYFEAFNFAVSESKRNTLGQKARGYYELVLELQPDDLDAKANLAVTYVTSAAPMQGIMMLREILEEEPTHEKALFNLGLLSITSGQFENAVERFSTLLEYHPENYEAKLYLGYSFLEISQPEKAKAVLESILNSDAEASIKGTAQSYLESIN